MTGVTLGERVKARRVELGLAQGALPGLDHSTLSRIESGKMVDPGLEVTRKLAAGLGLSLEELVTGTPAAVRMIPLCQIEADPENPRTVDVGLSTVDADFVTSVRTHGLLQAVTVRRRPADAKTDSLAAWRIAFGGRRYAALVLIHGPESQVLVPAKITEVEGDDLLLQQLVENVQRADMNPADLAEAITRLVAAGQNTDVLASALRKGRRWVQEQASVGKYLTPDGMARLRGDQLSISQAVALASEHDAAKQDALMSRAWLQNLNEDEIRAIIADDRAKEAAAKAAAEVEEQPALLPDTAGAKTYPVANEDGTFRSPPPDHRRRWTGKRGFFQISLIQFGDHKWTAGYRTEWRPTTSRSDEGKSERPPSRTEYVQQTAALALLDCARAVYPVMVDRAKNHPEDIPAMRDLHGWVESQIHQLGGTMRVTIDWRNNNPPPALPKVAKPAPVPKAAAKKVEKPLTAADVQKLPAWGKPLKLAYFVVLESGKATLVKGWKNMAAQLWKQLDGEANRDSILRPLGNRRIWNDDNAGRPFDYGGIVYRITDLKARP